MPALAAFVAAALAAFVAARLEICFRDSLQMIEDLIIPYCLSFKLIIPVMLQFGVALF